MPDPALLLDQVVAGYGGAPALDGVSLRVAPGEVVGVVGPNGSGKTTLVRVASRALRPREGRVQVAGVDPYAVRASRAARLVAVVPQDLVPVFSFTVLEVAMMGRSPYRSVWGSSTPEDWARVRAAMELTGVQHLADRPIEELSGGERRRVVLAQALAQDSPVLLLDEPTTHLDIRHVLDLVGTVRSLASGKDRAVLAVFHDLNLAAATCDRLVALSAGRVAAAGSPEEVVTPELLRSVYGVELEVHPSAATGRPVVALDPPFPVRPTTLGRAHVVGGAGRGASVMRDLAERGFEVSAGVLHGTDTDAAVAEALNLLRVTVPPFSEIDDESAREALDMMRTSTVVVVCDAPYGPGNVANLHIALQAAREGVRVVVVEQVPMTERDFTGGVATGLWEELKRAGSVARSYSDIRALMS
ncbi:MAG TPA: ABC transporter ATP-binding protein [Acidimicrobiales bacterium]|nr:ABC transporter ATP-binding protein [Acidimicrobiales bacterium]